MGILDNLRQRIEWHCAELDPRNEQRRAKRVAYDAKYDKCQHGTHDKGKCALIIRTAKVDPTDTTGAGIRVRVAGMAQMTYPYPYEARDPHEYVAMKHSGATSLRVVRETPKGYVFETETGRVDNEASE